MDKLIICFVGLIASGKDAAKKYLEEKYGAESFRFSSILRETLDALGVEKSRDNLILLSTWARENFGNDLLAKTIAKKAEEANNNLIIIDGARRLDDLIYLRKNKNFHLIAIEAEPKIRYERSLTRNENPGDKEKSYEIFLADHKKETEITIPETMASANFKIDNNGDFPALYRQIDDLMKNLDWQDNNEIILV
ncbi:AAA family ATPase [Patescibacteria group bacterium]|nr:AAA family ATPase [Patescibacteria group bacterium]